MWIIQIKQKMWIDAEKIDCFWVDNGNLKVTVTGDTENVFIVDPEMEGQFLNHLGAINNNHCCPIQSQVEEAKNDR